MGKRGRVKRVRVTGARDRRREAERLGLESVASSSRPVPSRELRQDVALLNAITAQKRGIEAAEKTLTKYVRQARRAGVTWTQIGVALGITQQAATKRWGPYPVDKSKPPRKPRRPSTPKVQLTPTTLELGAPRDSNLTQAAN